MRKNIKWKNSDDKLFEELSKLTHKAIVAQENGALAKKRLDSEYQSEMSNRGHQSRLESGYYESETHKKAQVNGGYSTSQKYPDQFKTAIQKWREENPEEYAKQQAINAEIGRKALLKGTMVNAEKMRNRTEERKQLLYDVIEENEITPHEAYAKYREHFLFWNDSACIQQFKRFMRGDLTRWEETGEKRNRSKVYRKIVK